MAEEYLSISSPMSTDDLSEHERVIERGRQTFVDVGNSLMAIRDGRGYRTAGFTTFEKYCQDRWGWQRTNAYYYIEAAQAALNVQSIEHPSTAPGFTQAIQLARLEPEAQREVAAEVDFEQTPVRELRQIVDERLGKPLRIVPSQPIQNMPLTSEQRAMVQDAVHTLNHSESMRSTPRVTMQEVVNVLIDNDPAYEQRLEQGSIRDD